MATPTTFGDDEAPGSVGTLNLGTGRTAVSLATGGSHACALLDNGTVRCWGLNFFGELGYGNTTQIGDNETPAAAGPVDLGAGRTAVSIVAGVSHTCALLDNGTVRCWGANGSGQLGVGGGGIGDNETPGSVAPINFGGGHTAVAIAAGRVHTCAILDDRTMRCWGNGLEGRLGYGNQEFVTSPSTVGPIDLGAGRTAVAIAGGEVNTCAVLDNGALLCWGDGRWGRLGSGNEELIGDNETPGSAPPVDLGANRNAIGIGIGEYHMCSMLDNGRVRCWGQNFSGQLGYGNTTAIGDDETAGAAGPVNLGPVEGAVETATGASHSCALFADGTVRCWGLGSSGQLGYASTSNIGDDENVGSAGPVDLGGRSAVEIATGASHTCALLDDGAVRCWGLGSSGQLGYGNTVNVGDDELPSTGEPIALGGLNALAITAGGDHTCAVLATGIVRCWGSNGSGQLGYANTTTIGDNESPAAAGPVALGGSATAISAGQSHTCATLSDGTSRCWGSGASGRLGYGNTFAIGDNENPSLAGAVSLGRSAAVVSAGGSHSCAPLDNGTVRCWGLAASGQLGYASTTDIGDTELPSTAGPVNLGSGRSGLAVSTGKSHTCAVLENGTLRCWGLSSSGQLGYGNTTTIGDNETPAFVGPVDVGTRSVVDVSTGDEHTCALLDNGTVRCWAQQQRSARLRRHDHDWR